MEFVEPLPLPDVVELAFIGIVVLPLEYTLPDVVLAEFVVLLLFALSGIVGAGLSFVHSVSPIKANAIIPNRNDNLLFFITHVSSPTSLILKASISNTAVPLPFLIYNYQHLLKVFE